MLYTLWGVKTLINHKTITFDSMVLFTNALIVIPNCFIDIITEFDVVDRSVSLLPLNVFDNSLWNALYHLNIHFL